MTMRWFTWCAASITLLAFLAPGRVLAANVYFVDYTFESFPDGSFRDRFSLSRVNADGTGREEVVHDMGPQPQYAGLVVEKGVVYWNGFDNVTRAATTAGVLLGPTGGRTSTKRTQKRSPMRPASHAKGWTVAGGCSVFGGS